MTKPRLPVRAEPFGPNAERDTRQRLLKRAYETVIGEPWEPRNEKRAAVYAHWLKYGSLHLTTSLTFACNALDLFRGETNPDLRTGILTNLDERLKLFQRDYPQYSFSSFCMILLQAAEYEDAQFKVALVDLALVIAKREDIVPKYAKRRGPSRGEATEEAAHRVALHRFFNAAVEQLGSWRHEVKTVDFRSTLDRLYEMTLRYPLLVTTVYVDTCCALLSLERPQVPAKISQYEAHHVMKNRLQKSAEAFIIQGVQARASRNMYMVAQNLRQDRMEHPFFSDACQSSLQYLSRRALSSIFVRETARILLSTIGSPVYLQVEKRVIYPVAVRRDEVNGNPRPPEPEPA
jgi:hypothetical protein